MMLGVAALALPALVAAQQSAAVNVRIVVAPVDRLGFAGASLAETSAPEEDAASAGTVGASSLGEAAAAPNGGWLVARANGDTGARGAEGRATRADAPATTRGQVPGASASAISMVRPEEHAGANCARPDARPGSPQPVLSVSHHVERPSDRAEEAPVQILTCTIVAR